MEYLIFDLLCNYSSLLENNADNLLKTVPFGSKYKKPILAYYDILVPLKSYDESLSMDDINALADVTNQYALSASLKYEDLDKLFSILLLLKPLFDMKQKYFTVDIKKVIDEDDLEIFYTDGSFKKFTTEAGFGCCKLLEKYNGPFGIGGNYSRDDFTGRCYTYQKFSGAIEEGTNNIGELTAIKTAFENFGDKKYHLIISDSIYGLKSFREYIHVWRNNGYLASNNKPIKNKELICDAYEVLTKAKNNLNTVFFAWTKGHAGNGFNEICDKLAKNAITK